MQKKKLTQPTPAQEKELLEINADTTTLAHIRTASYKISYMKPYTTERVTELLVENEVELTDEMTEFEALESMRGKSSTPHKCAALIILNDYWKIQLLLPFLWRYFFYIKQYNYEDLMEVVEVGKKKIQLLGFLAAMASLETMKETKMMMTRKEAKPFLQELLQGSGQVSAKRTDGL